MATILGLAMKVTADAAGFGKSLDPVDRALGALRGKADAVAGMFDRFTASSEAAANAQQQVAYDLTLLQNALKDNLITASDFAAEYTKIEESAKTSAAAFKEGAEIMAQYSDGTKETEARLARLDELLDQGAISWAVYNSEILKATGATEEAAEREKIAAADRERAAQITASVRKPIEVYADKLTELKRLQDAGHLSEETANRAREQARITYDRAAKAAQDYAKAAKGGGDDSLKGFKDLSGIVSLLPGQVGLLAARFSGLANAGTALQGIMTGGVASALSGVATSFASLINPATLAAAGIAAAGSAAAAAFAGLNRLSTEVEHLTNVALRMGASFEAIQTLDEAATRAGSSVEVVAAAMQKFQVNVDKARSGSGDAAEAFAELGLSQQFLKENDPTTIAQATAKALIAMEDPARRAALATETLGKKGLTLLPTFQAIGEAEKATKRYASAISEIDQTRLLKVDEAFDNIATSTKGLTNNLLTPFAGVVEGIANLFADLTGTITQFVKPIGDILQGVFDPIGAALAEVGSLFLNLSTIAGRIAGPFTEALGAIVGFLNPFNLLSVALGVVNTGLELLVGAIDAAIGAWNSFAESIPLVGQYLKVATDEGTSSINKLHDAASQPVELDAEISKEFQRVLDKVNSDLSAAIDKSAQFGQAGFDAALKYQEGIKAAQEQLDRGILNETSYQQAVSKASAEYEKQIDSIKRQTEEVERKRKADEDAASKAIEANRKIADEAIKAAKVQAEFGGDESRLKAAESVLAIQKEIALVTKDVEAAKQAGDAAAVEAGQKRLALLDQAQAREADIASGAAAERKKADEEKKKRDEERERALKDINKRIADEQAKIDEKATEQLLERRKALNAVQGGAIKVGDIRSSEGASTFLNLAGGKADPAIAEYKKQLKELREMRKDLFKIQTQRAVILRGGKI